MNKKEYNFKHLLKRQFVSDILKKIAEKEKDIKSSTTIKKIVDNFHEDAILIVMVLLTLPIAIPMPYPPGFTTVVGIPIILFAIQMIFKYKTIRLPRIISNYKIKNSVLNKMCYKLIPIVKKVEKYINPRMNFPQSIYCEPIIGIMCLIAGIYISLPIPLTNAMPALGIALMSLGLINKDGITIIIGVLITILGIVIATSVILFSIKTIYYFMNHIFK